MHRDDVAWWFVSAGIHAIFALVANLLLYETRAPIGRPQITINIKTAPPGQISQAVWADACRDFPPPEVDFPNVGDNDGDAWYLDVPDGPPDLRSVMEGGEPSDYDRREGGSRIVTYS